jgi:outer membrane protein TolC
MKNIFFVILILLQYSLIQSQETHNFSLEEAIQFGLSNNRTAQNASSDIAVAKKKRWETIASGLPQINLNVDYINNLKQGISLIPSQIFGGPEGEFTEVAFGTRQRVNATLRMDQLIFDGSYLVGIQASKVYLEISNRAKIKTDLEVKKAIIKAYCNVLLASQQISVLNKNVENLKANLSEVQAIYENGLTEKENVEQLQITLNSLENSLEYAQQMKIISQRILKMVLGAPDETIVVLSDSLEGLTLQKINQTIAQSPFVLENNIDFQIAQNNVASKKLLLKLARYKALPSITAFVNGGYNGNSDRFEFLDSKQPWYGASIVGVKLNIPVFSSLRRSASVSQARIELKKEVNLFKEIKQQLDLEVSAARSSCLLAIKKFNNAKKTLELAQSIERKNQVKFHEGLATSFELNQAQNQLYDSQNQLLIAMIELINENTNLETLLHQTLTK